MKSSRDLGNGFMVETAGVGWVGNRVTEGEIVIKDSHL